MAPEEERALRAHTEDLEASLEATRAELESTHQGLAESQAAQNTLDVSLKEVRHREKQAVDALATKLEQVQTTANEQKEFSDFLAASLARAELAAAAADARCQQLLAQNAKARGRLVADSTALRMRVSELEAQVGVPKQAPTHPPMSSLPPVPGALGPSPGAKRRALRSVHAGSGGVGWHGRGWRAKRSEWVDEDDLPSAFPVVPLPLPPRLAQA
jgi:septal ring factor EnvC (AmiA/AmiB activator)